MTPKHKEISEYIFKLSTFVLAETGLDTPLFVLIKDDQPIPVLIPPQVEIELTEYATYSLKFAKEHAADAMLFVSGMWVVSGPEVELDYSVRPSESKDREHYLSLVYISNDGKSKASLVGKVEQDPTGRKYVREQTWLDSVRNFNLLSSWK